MAGKDMLDDIRLHAHLIGKPGSRRELNTPVLVLDRDALGRNISKMAALAKRAGVALRPHAKTHKSLAIARLQLDAGAVGLCCTKLGEAEVLASGGVESILITSPVVSRRRSSGWSRSTAGSPISWSLSTTRRMSLRCRLRFASVRSRSSSTSIRASGAPASARSRPQ